MSSINCRTNRRRFLIASSQIALGILASPLSTIAASLPDQRITFFHTHTHERLTLCHSPGHCSQEDKEQLETFLRDFRTGEKHPIDPLLIDMLYGIQDNLKGRGVFEVISGYRSPKTNQYLRKKGNGVARKSLHMQGRAIDIRLSGLHSQKLRDHAIALQMGGVGYYPTSDFVHLDSGRFRTW